MNVVTNALRGPWRRAVKQVEILLASYGFLLQILLSSVTQGRPMNRLSILPGKSASRQKSAAHFAM